MNTLPCAARTKGDGPVRDGWAALLFPCLSPSLFSILWMRDDVSVQKACEASCQANDIHTLCRRQSAKQVRVKPVHALACTCEDSRNFGPRPNPPGWAALLFPCLSPSLFPILCMRDDVSVQKACEASCQANDIHTLCRCQSAKQVRVKPVHIYILYIYYIYIYNILVVDYQFGDYLHYSFCLIFLLQVAPFVECSSKNRRQLPICREQEIENYPTWIINGEKQLGEEVRTCEI